MNNLQKIYENLKSQNPNLSEDELKRMAWVKRDRMLFERSNLTVSSSSAAGAGGGGSGNRRIDPSSNSYVENGYIDNYFE